MRNKRDISQDLWKEEERLAIEMGGEPIKVSRMEMEYLERDTQ